MPQPAQRPAMPLAEILSDLTSLRVCDSAAAIALISARAPAANDTNAESEAKSKEEGGGRGEEQDDADIRRAKELVKLHYEVREAQKRGELGRGLEEARRMVRGVEV